MRAATGTSVDLTRAEFDTVRRLLEDQQTWSVVGRGTVDDLANRIADCLPPRDGRTAEDSHAAALTIARGLLEFAVADLDPKLFQQVLMARLQRMETDQASALDMALLGLHARFDSVMEQLKLVLDTLPPGPARRGEIAVYLRTLIDWLNTDPWPRDPQFGGHVLTPAAIERKLRIAAKGRDREHDLDADEMVRQCGRLVILGGPGSGKTWLAKRAARRGAEDALGALAAGGTLEEVELPLYTTASRLFHAGGDIREAVVSSALGQIGDLGGSRISTALREFFAERNAPTLLVIDSLDEAHGSSEVLRQVGTLPWRIVLTSRPSSWRIQLPINDTDESHRIGELQPLRYPDDVEPFIERWFASQPERGNDLAAHIARRPGLQQAATVPLILAFYCIIGGAGPCPASGTTYTPEYSTACSPGAGEVMTTVSPIRTPASKRSGPGPGPGQPTITPSPVSGRGRTTSLLSESGSRRPTQTPSIMSLLPSAPPTSTPGRPCAASSTGPYVSTS